MVSDSVVDERTPCEIHLAPFLCQRKTGAGNPAPVKRLNLYLSPIETPIGALWGYGPNSIDVP